MRKIIIFLVLTFSASVFADTYSAVTRYAMLEFGGDTYIYGSSYADVCAQAEPLAVNRYPQFPGIYTLLHNTSFCKLLFANGGQFNNDQIFRSFICPAGGSVSGTTCINAPACVAPQVRSIITDLCENPSVTCNYTPNLTTVGTTQTVSWQTDNTATNSCTDNSVSCNAPLVANVELKRCDLLCTDGTTVNVSGGAQCPPPVCVGGQTLNTATNLCEDPVCPEGRYLDARSHTCLTIPICVGGQTLDMSSIPYACLEPVCTGIQLFNTANHTCEDPAPAVCTGGQSLNTATNSCTDPVCASGYHLNAGKVCENDGECPLFTTKTLVAGVLKCVTTPTATDSATTTTNSPGTSSSTSTTTPATNPDGTPNPSGTSTTTTTTNNSGTTTTSTTNCPDCAKESTLREVVKNTVGKAGTSTAGTGDAGKWYTATDKTYQSVLQDGLTQIQNTPIMSFGRDIFSVTIPSGTCPTWTIPAVMGMHSIDVDVLCGPVAELMWPIVSGVLLFLAVVMAFRIALSAV